MTDDKTRDGKLYNNIIREAAKISALSLGKINKYEHITGKAILSLNRRQMIEKAKCSYSHLQKAFKKQTKTIEDQGKNHRVALKSNSFNSLFVVSSSFSSFILFILSIYNFPITFLYLLITVSRFSTPFRFFISLGKKKFTYNSHILRL